MAVKVRTVTLAEVQALNPWAHARQAPPRRVPCAQILGASAPGRNAPTIAPHGGRSAWRLRAWLRRVPRHGLAGGTAAPRSGRPHRHHETARGTGMALARTQPRRRGWPCARWLAR
jgi:hypothetical protein